MIKYIFCITTGRSGSAYLNRVFECVSSCSSNHEPKPKMNDGLVRDYFSGNKDSMRNMMSEKLNAINEARGEGLYVETNHAFIKGFGWELPNYIPEEEIGVVILKREKQKVVDSFFRIGSDLHMNRGRYWLLSPYKKSCCPLPISILRYNFNRLVMALIGFLVRRGVMSFFYPKWIARDSKKLLSWYYDETYALAERYKQSFPKISFFNVNTDELNNEMKVRELLSFFGLADALSSDIKGVVGVPVNLKR